MLISYAGMVNYMLTFHAAFAAEICRYKPQKRSVNSLSACPATLCKDQNLLSIYITLK